MSSRPHRIDWPRARQFYEVEGHTFASIAREVGCSAATVSRRARRDGWRDPLELSKARGEAAATAYLEGDAEAIRATLAEKHRLNREILVQCDRHLRRLGSDVLFHIERGDAVVREDPLLSLRRIALVVQSVHVVDASIAALAAGASLSAPGALDDRESEAVAAALRELEEEGDRVLEALDSISADRRGGANEDEPPPGGSLH